MKHSVFLQEHFDALVKKVGEVKRRKADIGRQMGEASSQGAETFHDNAPYEAAEADLAVSSEQLAELEKILHSAVIRSPHKHNGSIGLGTVFEIIELETGSNDEMSGWYVLGSVWIPKPHKEPDGKFEDAPIPITYDSPLGKKVIGKRSGESFHLKLREGERHLTVMEVM